jgi:hypothetical protein
MDDINECLRSVKVKSILKMICIVIIKIAILTYFIIDVVPNNFNELGHQQLLWVIVIICFIVSIIAEVSYINVDRDPIVGKKTEDWELVFIHFAMEKYIFLTFIHIRNYIKRGSYFYYFEDRAIKKCIRALKKYKGQPADKDTIRARKELDKEFPGMGK